jgi:hypothetical protein
MRLLVVPLLGHYTLCGGLLDIPITTIVIPVGHFHVVESTVGLICVLYRVLEDRCRESLRDFKVAECHSALLAHVV